MTRNQKVDAVWHGLWSAVWLALIVWVDVSSPAGWDYLWVVICPLFLGLHVRKLFNAFREPVKDAG